MSIIDKLVIVTEYVLSVAYPSDVIGAGTHAMNGWTILLGELILLALFILACGPNCLDRSDFELLLFVGVACGFGLIPLAFVFEPSLGLAPLGYRQPTLRHPYDYPRPMTALLGMIFVGTCVVGLGGATLTRSISLDIAIIEIYHV